MDQRLLKIESLEIFVKLLYCISSIRDLKAMRSLGEKKKGKERNKKTKNYFKLPPHFNMEQNYSKPNFLEKAAQVKVIV